MKAVYHIGEIVNVDLGIPPNEIKGHEQAKLRPCVIVKAFNNLELIIILPITGSKPPKYIFTYVFLPKGIGSLSKDSFALCHQIRVVSFDRINKRIGLLPNRELLKIQGVLRDMLEL